MDIAQACIFKVVISFSQSGQAQSLGRCALLAVLKMGQSTTFYRITQKVFETIEKEGLGAIDIFSIANGRAAIQDTGLALIFLLAKHKSAEQAEMIRQFFEPTQNFIDDPSGHSLCVAYTSPDNIEAVAGILDTIKDEAFTSLFDPEELNSAGIYPCLWRWETGPNQAYTEKHLLQDFIPVKVLVYEAARHKDYIVAFSG